MSARFISHYWRGVILAIAIFIIALYVSALTACAHGPSLDERMASYVGKPESDVTARFGAPDNVITMPDGTRALTWKKPWIDQWRKDFHICRYSFNSSAQGVITSWHYSDC